MKHLLALCLCLLLGACAAHPPLPETLPTLTLPRQLHVQREQDGQRQDWLLVIQSEDHRLRWSLLDLLGIPRPANCSRGRAGRPTACCHPTRQRANCSPPCCSP